MYIGKHRTWKNCLPRAVGIFPWQLLSTTALSSLFCFVFYFVFLNESLDSLSEKRPFQTWPNIGLFAWVCRWTQINCLCHCSSFPKLQQHKNCAETSQHSTMLLGALWIAVILTKKSANKGHLGLVREWRGAGKSVCLLFGCSSLLHLCMLLSF